MSSAAQVLRQAETLKASVSDSSKGISETWVARQRLEDLYRKLLLMDLEYALDKKVEQDLWNHAFKNHINNLQTQTKDKQNPKRGETQATLSLFLETASGFYLQLLQLICTTFKLDLPFRRKSSCVGIIKEKIPLKVKITPPKKSSCLYICQHCLVHLGDIARYRQQIEQAQTYYWHAANLLPFNGQPYNQLAIVEAANGNKLSTVFYYIRSLAVRHPFPVAATNLEKLYNKISKDMCEFKGKLSVSEMITAFLQFQAYIHMCVELKRADMLSEKLLAALPAHVTSQSFPSGILVQIVAINIFAMQHATRQTSDSADGSDDIKKWDDLTADEESSFQLMFNFTISVLDVLLQYTPKQEQKLRDFFTLPAVKLLLDWFKLNPEHLSNPTLKTSTLWTNLCKVLNNIRPAKDSKVDVTKYEELPLTEDVDLRCFQPLEKAHSGYSFSRVPSEGLPSEVESQLRCQRLLSHGRWIAEEHPSLNLLNIQTNKTGKLQFTAPSVHVKLVAGTGVDTTVASPERNSKRQNVAIQAIIQKQSQNAKAEQTDKPSTSKSAEKVKTVMVSESSTRSSHTPSGTSSASPKYLLGVPTSEPLFMKSGSSRQSSNSQPGIIRNVAEKPPRLQKQHQLQQQQQQQQQESGNLATGQQPVPWQQQKQKQSSPKQQQKVLWQQPSQQTSKEATPQLLTKPQLSPQPTQLLTKQQQQLSPQPQLLTKQQLSPQPQVISKQQVSPQPQQLMTKQQQAPPQSGVPQQLLAQQPSQNKQPPLQQQQMAPPVNQQQQQTPQNQNGQTTKPFMILQSEYRSSPRMSVSNQQPTARDLSMMFSQRPPMSSQEGPQNHIQGKMNTPYRQQMANDAMPGSSFDMMPPNMSHGQNQGQMHGQGQGQMHGQGQGQLHGQNQGQMHGQNQGPMHMQGQNQNPAQGQIHSQGHHDLGVESIDVKQQQLRSPSMRGVNPNMQFPGNFPPGAGPQFGGKGGNSMPPPPSQPQPGGGGPGPMGPNQFPRNGPPPNVFFGNKGNMPPFPGNQMNFPPAPGSDRMQVGGFKQPPQGGPPPPPQQNQTLNRPPQMSQQQPSNSPGFQGPMFNPLALLSNINRFGLGHPSLGNMDQAGLEQLRQGMRKEDLQATPADILGALTLLAVQPPRSIQENTTTSNRLMSSFQGHAEGTPKPDTGISPSRSPLIQPEQDTRPVSNATVVNPNPQQQGTYSLFSSSPWSVPLSTSDTKSMGSSPFSSESNSIRNSPDPAAIEISENKHGHGLDLGLRFGTGDDWRDKGHAVPHPDTQHHQGGGSGPFFSSTFQSIWSSSQGQSPLERLLEKQQKQRQNDPH